MSAASAGGRNGRGWPVLSWVPGYQRGWFRPDFIAGLTVCAILVPEGMAYAQLAGVPPETAFYAAPIGLLAYAVLGGSRQLVVAVSSAIAIMSGATVALVAPADTPEFVAMTAALALLAGLVSIAAGLLKLGRIAQFFSESVLVGFVFGLALLITIKQIPKLLGVEAHGDTAAQILVALVPQVRDTHLLTLAVGVLGIAGMIAVERFLPRIPAALVVMIVSIGASVALGLSAHGVAVVGDLPAGLIGPSLPGVGLDALPLLIAGAVGIALVAFAEAIGPANDFARRHGGTIDPNQELIALGAANAGAGLFSGFPIGSSLSKSAANERAGANTPASLVVAAAATALVALFLTPLFESLPEATLGAVVVVAVSGMLKFPAMERLWRLRRIDFWLALVALVGVLVVPTLQALGIAVVASLGMVVWRASEPRITLLGRRHGQLEPVDIGTDADAVVPNLVIARPDEMLFFANANPVRDALLATVARQDPRPRVLLLDLSMTHDMDVPAAEMLADLHGRLDTRGTALWLCNVRVGVLDLLDRAGVLATLGPEWIHPTIVDGVLAFLRDTPEARERVDVLRDVIAYVHERRAAEGITAEGADLLASLEQRLAREVEASEADAPA